MRGPMRLGALVLAVLLLAACTGSRYIVGIRWADENAPPDASGAYSGEDGALTYEDPYVKLTFAPVLDTAIRFTLLNKTDSTMRLIWDDASYVGVDGTSSRVMHAGVRYIDRNLHQPPSVIPAGARIDDILLPTENVRYVSGRSGGWKVDSLVPDREAPEYDGRDIGLLIPVEIDGETHEYTFHFEIVVRENR